MTTEKSDGTTASYYELPEGCTELQDLIGYRNLNAQDGEIFRAIYRKGRASHSDELRDARKVLFYAAAEVKRLEVLEQTRDDREFPLVCHGHPDFEVTQALIHAPTACQVMCFGHTVPTPPGRMTWQDVAKLSAVHRVFIRGNLQWWEVVPRDHPEASGSTICNDGVYFMVRKCDGHKADV